MPSRGENFFLVLPDSEAARPLTSRLKAIGLAADTVTVCHPSGRPWIVGRWGDGELVHARAGDVGIALVGQHSVTEERLLDEAGRLTDLADLDALARRFPGCFHLLGSIGGELRVQGTLAGLRLVFHASVDGVAVAADRADVLGVLAGRGVDELALATRLLHPMVHPLTMMSLWRGVSQLPQEAYLLIGDEGRTRETRRWWEPPAPELSLAEAAPLFRDALIAAVEVRARPGRTVCCDLSGGFDSTTVCFLAARAGASVVALTVPGRDPADEDLIWAKRAAGYLPAVEHDVIPLEEMPLLYADMFEADDPLDEPTQAISRSSHQVILRRIAGHGARVHLTGDGGDAVLIGSASHLHDEFRRNPRGALRKLNVVRAMARWPLAQSLRALAAGGSYADWLRRAADELVAAPSPHVSVLLRTPKLGWGFPPRLPSWATPETLEGVRGLLREAASTVEPLGRTLGQHGDMAAIRTGTLLSRPGDQLPYRMGIASGSPFFDDQVVEVALAIRPEDRVMPGEYKPLLRAAMHGIVPQPLLERTNKAESSIVETTGRQQHRGDLIALFEDSELRRAGLIDGGLHRLLRDFPTSPEVDLYSLYATLRCEMWLRTHLGNHVSPSGPRLRPTGAPAA